MNYKSGRLMSLALPGIVAIVITAVPTDGEAISAWSRKYKLDCTTCHFGSTNRLTQFGKDFQMRGNRTADEESVKDIEEINLANYASFAGKFRFDFGDGSPSSKFDVEALSIYSGGSLYENFSYFFEIYLHERGNEVGASTGVREKLAEAYVLYNSNPNSDNYWFARAGSFTPRIVHTSSTGGRVSISRPRMWNDQAGQGNLFTPRDRFYGVTAGFHTESNLMGEVGITNGGGGNARPNQAENNNFKDVFGAVEYEFDDFGSSVGLLAYKGQYPATDTPGPPIVTYKDDFTRYAVTGSFVRDKFEVSGAYGFGRNTNSPSSGGGTRNPEGFFLEGAYLMSDDLAIYGRYDHWDTDLGTPTAKTTGGALGLSYRLSNVGRAVIEGTRSKSGGNSTDRVTFELNWIF